MGQKLLKALDDNTHKLYIVSPPPALTAKDEDKMGIFMQYDNQVINHEIPEAFPEIVKELKINHLVDGFN